MRRIHCISRFVRNAFMTLPLLAVCLSSCVREEAPGAAEQEKQPGFFIQASIFNNAPEDLSGRTKAKTDDNTSILAAEEVEAMNALRENYIGSIDIFVKESAADAGSAWFKTYHLLPANADDGFTSGTEIKLHDNWSTAGYVPGTPYDIFIVANDPHTLAGSASLPANLTELRALATTDSEIYKYYTTETGNNAPYGHGYMNTYPASHEKRDKKKEFRMDCTLEGWTIDPNSSRQVFDARLQRDVAKIILRVHYGSDQNIPLVSEDGSESEKEPGTDRIKSGSLKEYLKYIGRTEVGTPRWKYNNFCFTDGDFASSATDDGTDLRSYGSSLVMNRDDADPTNFDIDGLEDWHYTLVTYSAPFAWNGSAEHTPFVLYSVMFTDPRIGEGEEGRNKLFYYRLPVCDERHVSSLERNHIYIVDVSICSLGSENANLKMEDSELRIEYHVIPWTEHEVAQNATTTVLVTDTQYLSVSPQEYTLKGNNTQSVTLNYFASLSTADGRFLDIENTSTQLKVEYENYMHTTKTITGTVTKQVQTGENTFVTATSANTDGKKNIVFTSTAPGSAGSPDATNGTQGETVKLTITPDGHITIASQALENRAVKKITFTVTLLTSGLSKTVVIKHAPLDNIKNIQGWFSYKIDSDREYSFNPTADGWDSWDGYEDNVETTLSNYSIAETAYRSTRVISEPTGSPSDYDSRSATETGTDGSALQTAFRNAVPRASRSGANSEANAYKEEGSNYWYWGTTQTNGSYSNFDWYTSLWYYRWYNYNRRIFYKNVTHYYARRYYRDAENTNWIIWNRDSQTPYTTSKTFKDHMMQAKVYENGSIYNIVEEGSAGNYIANHESTATAYTNRQMYVIQITSASSDYVIGYPHIVDYESQDQVVSPAFMLASQLGGLTTNQPLSFDNAKEHCGKYIEVGENGYVYRNWRLPTVGEIQTIINYQGSTNTKNITMATVLTGRYYWALDGTSQLANSGDYREYYWVRCVRDLTLDELETLNQ